MKTRDLRFPPHKLLRQTEAVAHGILEQPHPETPLRGFEIVLVEENDVLRKLSGSVVGTDTFGERAQVVAHVPVRDGVGLAVIEASYIVDPENVVILGRMHRASHL